MALYRIEIQSRDENPAGTSSAELLREAGLTELRGVRESRIFLIDADADEAEMRRKVLPLLVDDVAESARLESSASAPWVPEPLALEVHPRPGVMDPVADTVLTELRAAGVRVESVRTGRRYVADAALPRDRLVSSASRVLANDCIEELVPGSAGLRPAPVPPVMEFRLRYVELRSLDDAGLERLARDGHLFLSRAEMQAIRAHYQALERDPSDIELETLAQTWSEHCVHKTLKSEVLYRGAPFPHASTDDSARPREVTVRYGNLLRETIAGATYELIAKKRGPECLSVFVDNAGIIGFDDEFAVAFKVETHNHPSAIEPYGGAATGVGGCIRDVIGCGLGARPIANTDVFCVAPGDWPLDGLPRGVLHPRRVLRGIVRGVADYGNRMGIPTVNGAIHYDPRYLGNPLVYCGCVGIIPRNRIEKRAQPGDRIVVIGGRTGRDGIHGATFSSAELTDTHADEFSHAVQIGNAITEKRFLDGVMRARDAEGGCLYNAITDCGAGGLSSAVGEMASEIGAVVDLEQAPLKYAGLRYDEIWISEAQERMVLAVPPENLKAFLQLMDAEEVEAAVIGEFGHSGPPVSPGMPRSSTTWIEGERPRLQMAYRGTVVGDIDLQFLHDGVPKLTRAAEWHPRPTPALNTRPSASGGLVEKLRARLGDATTGSKEWVIRKYDHEVQGGSAVKPLVGRGEGPSDGAVLTPRLGSLRGIALGCGLAPQLFDLDPYWMAVAAIDEAIRNIVCVGGDPRRTAILDNFCWARTDEPRQMGALVRACQACRDAALTYGTPFISGKDSLNNEFALDERDVDSLVLELRKYAERESARTGEPCLWQAPAEERVRSVRRLAIPGTLLVSALAMMDDVRRAVTSDLKRAGNPLILVLGQPTIAPDRTPLEIAAQTHLAVADSLRTGLVRSAHDASEGGWLTAAAEMAIGGGLGCSLTASDDPSSAFELRLASYVLETDQPGELQRALHKVGIENLIVGAVTGEPLLRVDGESVAVSDLAAIWHGERASG